MATIQLTIPDSLVTELDGIATGQGYASLQDMLKATLRSLLLRSRLEQNTPSVTAQVAKDLP